jgi:transcriptional regulator with XRE-family HTH domain
MEEKDFYTLEEVVDDVIGKKGTARRDAIEEELQSFLIGEAIKKARKEKNMTQEQLGTLMGVQRAQVSRIENGHNLTINTIARAFKALNVSAHLDLGNVRLALYTREKEVKSSRNIGGTSPKCLGYEWGESPQLGIIFDDLRLGLREGRSSTELR